MLLTERDVRSLAKDVGLTPEKRLEIVRILKENDYTAEFPLQGSVTYAVAAIFLDIISEANLELKCLPLAISVADKSVTNIGTNIKRTIDRKVKNAKSMSELFCTIESLYAKKSILGPGCSAAKIDEAWLQGEASFPADSIITNRIIIELVCYVKTARLQWNRAKQWLCRFFPDSSCDKLLLQTISTNWLKIQRRARQIRGKKGEEAYLSKIYSPPTVRVAREVQSTSAESHMAAPNKEFPGDAIIGKRIRHRFDVSKSGKIVKKWFTGTVLRKASEQELHLISDEDQDIANQGYTLFIVKYDNENQIELFALKWDWDCGDLKLL